MACRILFLALALASLAAAQSSFSQPGFDHVVKVHINFENGAECDSSTTVELMKSSTSIARGFTDRNCEVDLPGVSPGNYHLVISGREFAAVESGDIALTSFDDATPIEVRIPRAQNSSSPSASASVADLKVPRGAAKEFNKATREMQQQDWKSAAATLQRAIKIYPQYAAAYNNLGVVYARIGDRSRELEALEQAITIDSRYAPAHLNLARMDIAANKFPEAEVELKQAASLEPADGVTLVLLSYVEYMDRHFDDAVSDCRKVHALNDVPHAFAHWTAAIALEQKNQIAEAGDEFRAFVKEEPSGDRADAARKELANIAAFLAGNK
jgi:tetratricopeptide (TPR) repeat protein